MYVCTYTGLPAPLVLAQVEVFYICQYVCTYTSLPAPLLVAQVEVFYTCQYVCMYVYRPTCAPGACSSRIFRRLLDAAQVLCKHAAKKKISTERMKIKSKKNSLKN